MSERQNEVAEEKEDNSQNAIDEGKRVAQRTPPEIWRILPAGVALYEWQKECLPLWLSKGRGTIKVATGGGKTMFALAAAEKLQNECEPDLRLVVVVPTIPLMFQWYDEIRCGNLPETAIGRMGGGQELPPVSNLRVLICVLNSARDQLPGLVSKAGWSEKMLLVVDECHRANADQAKRIFDARPKYTLGLSATPEKDLEVEDLPTDEAYQKGVVGQALGPILYTFTIEQSLSAGLLTPFEVWHIGLSLTPEEANRHAGLSREISDLRKSLQGRHRNSRSKQGFIAWCQTQASKGGAAKFDAERFIGLANRRKRLLYKAEARSDVVMRILSESIDDPEVRAIVFHESIEEIEALFLAAEKKGLPVVLEHSKLPGSLRAENIDLFRRGIARIIISAKSLVEGFNVPSADLGVIAASSGSVRQRIQSLGRMLRRKAGGRSARILVLYVRDTEDETIYEKADWETIIGAERNRYFYWNMEDRDSIWTTGLKEISTPPRRYRPSPWEIDVGNLHIGDIYPGRADGLDLKVDHAGNLRTDNGTFVPVPGNFIDEILLRNPYKSARLTPAGHLIVRGDPKESDESGWKFVGMVKIPDSTETEAVTRLRIMTVSGRRKIAFEDERGKGKIKFALGPAESHTPESGEARDRLLEWTRRIESERHVRVREIYWDNKSTYWLEIAGQKIVYEDPLPPLEIQP